MNTIFIEIIRYMIIEINDFTVRMRCTMYYYAMMMMMKRRRRRRRKKKKKKKNEGEGIK